MSDHISVRQQRLLVFLGAGETGLDPIRIMKGLFLFEMKAPDDWQTPDTLYSFVPYNYGAFSPEVYRDLEYLSQLGFVQIEQAPNRSWNYYSLTKTGKDARGKIAQKIDRLAAEYLVSLRKFVDQVSFRQLLETIYREYPDYAVNSVFK